MMIIDFFLFRMQKVVNHEYNDDDNDGNGNGNESIKENVMDESSQSFYQTPDLKLAKTMSNVVYELRQTPLRRLHQNGNLPYRETRSNVGEFNKRKSYSHRKSMKTIRFDKEFETQTFDFSQMSEVLDGVTNDNGDCQLSNQEKITTDTVDDKQNNDETIADKPDTNGAINEDLLSENEDLLSENEEPEDNFHEISTDDLEQPKSSIVDNVNERSEIDLNPDQSFKRQSYLVTSPVVRIVIADNEKECLPENIESTDIMKTPSPMNEAEQRKLKIKNRKPTPMFGILRNKKNTETTTKKMVTIDNDRSQKYWKRFSRTLNQDDDANDKTTIDEQSDENEKPKNVAVVVDGKENRKQVTIEDSNKDVTPQPKKSLSTNNISRKSLSMATINRLSTLPQRILSERKSQRYMSMAEQTQRFLHSARQYQPKGVWQRNKLTKPRPPRLLTAIRSECRRKIEAESNRIATLTSSSSIETTDSEATIKSAKPIPPKIPSIQQQLKKPIKRQLTKARTPIFCTDYRSKIYQLKHRNDQQDGNQPGQFRARPMPDFKKIQARAAAAVAAQAINKNKNNKV